VFIVPLELFVQYGTTRLKVDPVDGSLSYPEPARNHGTHCWLVSNLYHTMHAFQIHVLMFGPEHSLALSLFGNLHVVMLMLIVDFLKKINSREH
jgi:hypothetical protein